jgi:hypothetical protein
MNLSTNNESNQDTYVLSVQQQTLEWSQIPTVNLYDFTPPTLIISKEKFKHPSSFEMPSIPYCNIKHTITMFFENKGIPLSKENTSVFGFSHPSNQDARFAIVCRSNGTHDTYDIECKKMTEPGKYCDYVQDIVGLFAELKESLLFDSEFEKCEDIPIVYGKSLRMGGGL